MLCRPKADTGTNPSCFCLVASLSSVLSTSVLNCLHPLQVGVSVGAFGLAATSVSFMCVLPTPVVSVVTARSVAAIR